MKNTLIVLILFFGVTTASAESRGRHYAPETLRKMSTLVFTGKVLEITKNERYKLSFPSKSRVDNVIKGELKEKELSFAHKNPGRCVIFEEEYNTPVKGDEGTFYIQNQGGTLVLIGYITKNKPACGDRGLLLTISVPGDRFNAGQVIPMTFDIKNAGSKDVSIPIGFRFANNDRGTKLPHIGSGTFVICRNDKGDYLKFKGRHSKVSGVSLRLPPGEKIKAYTLDLSQCFDLKPGIYDIQLLFTKRYSGFIDGASNRITLKVDEAKPEKKVSLLDSYLADEKRFKCAPVPKKIINPGDVYRNSSDIKKLCTKLKMGISHDEVVQLIGSPRSKDKHGWHYSWELPDEKGGNWVVDLVVTYQLGMVSNARSVISDLSHELDPIEPYPIDMNCV